MQAKSHPNTFAWFCLVGSFTEPARQSWTASAQKQGGKGQKGNKQEGGKKKDGKKGKKEEKKDDVEMDDLFGDDDEADAEAAKKAAEAAKAGAKKKKKQVIAMSLVLLEVKPLDSETNLDDLAQKIFNEIT